MIPQEYFDKVKKYYFGDEVKTWDWFKTVNPNFGMLSPLIAMKLGRQHRVTKYIDFEMCRR